MKKRLEGKAIPKQGKKKKVSSLKVKLWKIVSKKIKERDDFICYTSGRFVQGMSAHCGHGLPSSVCGARLRYHPKNLHCQSYYENIHASGNGVTYYQNQVRDYGQEVTNNLYKLQNKFIKADSFFYEKLIDLYTNGTWEDIEHYLEN